MPRSIEEIRMEQTSVRLKLAEVKAETRSLSSAVRLPKGDKLRLEMKEREAAILQSRLEALNWVMREEAVQWTV